MGNQANAAKILAKQQEAKAAALEAKKADFMAEFTELAFRHGLDFQPIMVYAVEGALPRINIMEIGEAEIAKHFQEKAEADKEAKDAAEPKAKKTAAKKAVAKKK
jgi:hypothetical protein